MGFTPRRRSRQSKDRYRTYSRGVPGCLCLELYPTEWHGLCKNGKIRYHLLIELILTGSSSTETQTHIRTHKKKRFRFWSNIETSFYWNRPLEKKKPQLAIQFGTRLDRTDPYRPFVSSWFRRPGNTLKTRSFPLSVNCVYRDIEL